jgi:ribosomal protein S18 acetylase RimI-like enzyme
MTHIIRRATRTDVPAIVGLLMDDYLGAQREGASVSEAPYEHAFEAIDKDPNHLLAVMELEGRIVGCLQLTFLPGLSRRGQLRGQVEGVRVAGDVRGQGLGHRLLEWAIGECRRRGCGVVQLTTDASRKDAQRFYESLGFTASHVGMKLGL